jgi:hypothetical protein
MGHAVGAGNCSLSGALTSVFAESKTILFTFNAR